jgi:hypothetical protein
MKNINTYIIVILCTTIFSCSNSQKPGIDTKNPEVKSSNKNFLTMKIDGKDWIADRDIFGSYHFNEALGPKMINIAGEKGDPPNDQPFNINLYNTEGPGEYKVDINNKTQPKMYENVAQLAQFTPQNYLCGGLQQANMMTIKIIKASQNPQMVEATFSGTMKCVEGNTLTITDGKFYYNEAND